MARALLVQVDMKPLRPFHHYHPGDAIDWPAVRAALAGLELDDTATALEQAGTDYHWYSPILQQRLLGRRPDLVVRTRGVDEIARLAAVCARHHVPLTVRGGGTGNYGQCVPLFGGIVLDITRLNRVLRLEPGWASVQAGISIHALNLAARETGQQLRMWPSTERIATLGGFIAGGHSGIGSVRHGILADTGNVRRLRIVTLEDPPSVLDLVDADIQKAHHAYGSNGIITEVDVALTGYVEWQHTIALFDLYDHVLRLGLAVTAQRAIDVFQLSAVERRITPYYAGLRERLHDSDAMFAQVSPQTLPAYESLVAKLGGHLAVQGTEQELLAAGLPSATECAYNHTTLEALKSDRGVTYLQMAYPAPLDPALVAAQMARFGDEVYFHHEFSRAGGRQVAFALPLVQFFDEAQLQAVRCRFEDDGCIIFDAHTWVLEDGGMKHVDEDQLAFKQLADPQGLMNPGKVRAWDERVLGRPGGQL